MTEKKNGFASQGRKWGTPMEWQRKPGRVLREQEGKGGRKSLQKRWEKKGIVFLKSDTKVM